MYVLNKITVIPQLPERIRGLSEIANNVWWSWNTEFLKLFKEIDIDLWEKSEKNPVKFLSEISQEKLSEIIKDEDFLKIYDEIYDNYKDYINSKNTWFAKKYPNNKQDVFAYFSAEYGLDEVLPIYSGGLGILSGDHLKSASDLGIPLVAVGLLYRNGYFRQQIGKNGEQETIYKTLDISKLPIKEVTDKSGNYIKVSVQLPNGTIYLKLWQINVGRVKLYLLDSDLTENPTEYKNITSTLYGGDKENRIMQEIVLGIGGSRALDALNIVPTVYHMNEGHSSFLLLELIMKTIQNKQVSFNIAKDIVSSKTVFTTHTPVPAGNDIFTTELVKKYFSMYPDKFGISEQEFLELGMLPNTTDYSNFNMGILALKIAGKKNGVSKLHGEVSRKLFTDIWPNITSKESPITYVTNGIHTCSWLAPNLKKLYNKYMIPFWQDSIYNDKIWKDIKNIPDEKLWNEHMERKSKLLTIVKDNTVTRLKRNGYTYEEIASVISGINTNALTIGFARRFATYKRATLIFKDLERIKQILNDTQKPVQLIFAGKAHPADKEGQNLIKYIHELSMKPEFKGKIFLLEDYSIAMSRYLISGVDVWLNNPRRPMEASGTSGQKASVNGVINFSVLDGWWAEGFNSRNGWKIGNNCDYDNYDIQDMNDSESIYTMLEKRIIPTFYSRNEKGIPKDWVNIMKESIITTGGRFSTARMLVDYMEKLYMPLCNLTNKYYTNLDKVTQFNKWKKNIYNEWDKIEIIQSKDNINDKVINAGNSLNVKCIVKLPHMFKENISVEVFYGKANSNGIEDEISVIPMKLVEKDDEQRLYTYVATIKLDAGGEFAYTFRVIPKHEMLLDPENLNLIKWIE